MSTPLTAKRLTIRVISALVLLAAVVLACSLVGPEKISLGAVLWGPGDNTSTNTDYEIFVHIRLPRVILAAIVGMALACSGVIFQALLRNPLADPYILGISSGAGLGAIIAVIGGFSWTFWGNSAISIFAFLGAVGTVWLVWSIGRFAGRYQITGLLLAGVVVNAFFSAIIMFLTSIAKSQQVHSTIFWLMGNMSEKDFGVLWFAGGCVVAGAVALFYTSSQLNVMSFGEEDARSVGVNTSRTRIVCFAVAAGITAVAVSLSGLIGFVGLVVPHEVRLVLGPDHMQLIPVSGIAGAVFLVAADTLARVVVAPAQLPVGVVTAIVGGPFFLILLVRHSRRISGLEK